MKPDKGRIFFYRRSLEPGVAVQAAIYVNGVAAGSSQPDGFFFVDHAPGQIEVKTETETEEKITFTLAPGQVRYVRTYVGMGVLVGRVYLELIDPEQGANELKERRYTGAPLASR